MRVKLIINGVDFSPYLKRDGLKQYEIVRQGRSVTALDGTLYKSEITKRGMDAALVELRDTVWYRLAAALEVRPATVSYIDDTKGDRTALFYPSNPSNAARVVQGGITYFSGASFTLEEK